MKKITDGGELEMIQSLIDNITDAESIEHISDGYHTFKELYDMRMALTSSLFNTWSKLGVYNTHKSKRHNDGELCFGGGWFIICATTSKGDISFHYPLEHWDKFEIDAVEVARKPFDGHTSEDVIDRLLSSNLGSFTVFKNMGLK